MGVTREGGIALWNFFNIGEQLPQQHSLFPPAASRNILVCREKDVYVY